MWRLTISACFLGVVGPLSYMEFHSLFVELELATRPPREYISPFSKIAFAFLVLSRHIPLLEVVFMYVKTWAFGNYKMIAKFTFGPHRGTSVVWLIVCKAFGRLWIFRFPFLPKKLQPIRLILFFFISILTKLTS